MLLSSWLNAAVSRLRGARQQTSARSRHGVVQGTSLSAAVASQSMLLGMEVLEDRALLSAATVNFDALDATAGFVSGATLDTYLAGFGITLASFTAGTTVGVANDLNVYGGDPINPPSIPNIFSQFDLNTPVSFTLNFATALTSFAFTRPQLVSTGGGVSHPAWQAYAFSGLDGTGTQLSTASEIAMGSSTAIPEANFLLGGLGIRSVRFDSQNSGTGFNAVLLDNFSLSAPLTVNTVSDVLDVDANTSSLSALALAPGADGFVSLREALTASNNDTLDFQNNIAFATSLNGQTITLGGTQLPAITKSVQLNSPLGVMPPSVSVPLIMIDANDLSRIFEVDASMNPVDFSLERFVLMDGSAGDGGALLNHQGNVKITNSTLTSNLATHDGGAIYNDRGHVELKNNTVLSANSAVNNGGGVFALGSGMIASILADQTTITGNTAGGSGGGIFSQADFIQLNATNVTNNSATNGGGVAVTDTTLVASGGSFANNTATSASASLVQGGAIAATGSFVNLFGTTLTMNSAIGSNAAVSSGLNGGHAEGGAVSLVPGISMSSSLYLAGPTLENNTVAGGQGDGGGNGGHAYGGAIYIGFGGSGVVGYGTMATNHANGGAAGATGLKGEGEGGGLWTDAGVIMENITLSGNTAMSSGGGVYLASGSGNSLLIHVTAFGNRADSDGDGDGTGGGLWRAADASTVTLDATLVAGNLKGNGSTTASDVQGTVDGTSVDSLIGVDVGLVGITHGSNGNQIGTVGSPIDPLLGPLANNNGLAPFSFLTKTHALLTGSPASDAAASSTAFQDQRGFTRSGVRDIGAYEAVLDFGDAPTAVQSGFASSYPTTLANSGARHVIGGLSFGSIDAETDGQPAFLATGDDFNNVNDERGVTGTSFVVSFSGGTAAQGSVTVESTGVGFVSAWIDFNLDGVWDGPGAADDGERILNDAPVVAGSNQLMFPIPNGLSNGITYGRFRIAPLPDVADVPTGLVQDGEVEDYPVSTFAVVLPGATVLGVSVFNPPVPTRTFYDPAIAIGYDYAISSLDGATFESVTLTTLPNGDSSYELWIDGGSGYALVATLTAGLQYFFTTGLDENGASFMTAVPGGLGSFRILGINTNELVDPADPVGFVTGLSFSGFTGSTEFTMTGIAKTIYVDNPGDFLITDDADMSSSLTNGDTVTWIGNPGDGGTDDVTGLIFGATAFGTVTSALNATETGETTSLTTIRVGYGTFFENLTILTGATLVGSGAANTILDGSASGSVITVNGGATASLSDLKITNGSGESGGGILNDGTLTVTNSTITGNTNVFDGGGVNNTTTGIFTITNSTVSGNSADFGGGIRNDGTVTVVNSTVSNNNSAALGGGLFNDNSGTLTVTNSTISGNSSGTGGGIQNDNDGTVTVTNSTITGNTSGGGIDTSSGGTASTTIKNSIVAGNTSSDLSGKNVEAASINNLIGDAGSAGGLMDGVDGNIVGNGGVGTIVLSTVLDPMLANNGGPTLTHALLAGSPAIDAGSNAAATAAGLTTDQRGPGFARIVNGGSTATVDIGAFEFVPPVAPTPTLTIDDVSVMETNSGTTAMTFTVTLGQAVSSGFTVDYVIQDGIATLADNDYVGGQSGSLRIGAFNGARGGDFSLSDGSSAAAMKSLIQTTFPAATITGTSDLTTPGFLANVDVMWLNSVFNNTTATSPLSGAEQTALLNFVNGGGRAIIFGENEVFDDSSLLAPFGAATTGNLVFLQTGTITNQTDVITNGPFGLVSTLQGNYSGTFTTLGAATALGAWGNGGTSVAVLQPNALSAGSGRVLLLSDVNYYADQLGAADNSTLLLNALFAMRTPPPHLTFLGNAGESHMITVTINGDLTNEADETLHVLLSNIVGNAEVTIADGDGLGTIENDDAVGDPPVITSNGGGVTADLSVAENTTAVLTTVTASDADLPGDTLTFSISGGADAAKFMLHPMNHELTFVATPDFENPTDADLDNVYEVFVSVSDLIGNLDTQVLSVTVTDVQSTLSIDDVTDFELNSGMSNFTFTVTLGSAVAPFSVRYGTQDGTATVANNDYVGTAPGTLRIGAFDGSRGGIFSLSDGANAAAVKSLIQSSFSGATITGTSTLTTAFLSTVDVVWLNSVSGNTSATTPLTGAEQAALLAFVQNGGHALIFGENAVFDDESLLDPFNARTSGTLTDLQTGTITNTTHALTAATAPFGAVTTLQGFFPGNLSELGAATALGTWNGGNGTNVAVLDPGVISADSGRVVLLADVNFYADQLNSADNKKLLLNALASMVPASSVTLPFAGMANETQTIQVSVKGDTTLEGDETFRVLLGQLSGTNDVTIVKGTGIGMILNDDGGNRPVITSDLGGATAMKSVAENSTAVTTVIATDADIPSPGDTLTYSITGGADAAKFAIVSGTGVLTFKTAPDFENPSDADLNNIYQVTVTVADAIGQLDSQALSVTVTDLQATLSIADAAATEGSPLSFQVTLSNAIGTGFTVDYASQDGTATVAGGDYVAVTAGNLRIGAFDATRGGIFSLSNGSSAAAMRALITSSFSGVTFVGLSTLTSASLADVDVVWLNSVSSNTSATSALTSDEKDELLAFVQTGGHAMIFGENSAFDDESLLDKFNATTTGTLAGIQAGSITNTTHVLTAAGSPFGAVTSLQGNFSGKFNDTDLGMATQLGVWTSAGVTNNTSVAVIDPGVLATNSGRVVLFSDVNFYNDQLNAADNSKLLLNALATMLPPAPLAFTGTQVTPEILSISVTTNSDALISEGDELLSVLLGTLSGTNDVTITQATGQGTIHNGPSSQHNVSAVSEDSVSVMINDVLLREGNSGSFKAVFTVQLSEVSDETVTVRYATVNATATSGVDYKSANGTLTFAPGQTTKTFTILVTGDKLAEATEFFDVHFESSANADLVRDTAQVTIVDNDPIPSLSINNATVKEGTGSGTDSVFTVKLSKASGTPVTVHFTSLNGTAVAGSDFDQSSGTLTFAPGQTTQTVKVHVTGDSLHETNENFQLLLSDATNATIRTSTGKGTIKNDDKAPSLSIGDVTVLPGNIAVFTVILSAPSGQDVTVKYATASGSAKASQDFTAASGTLTFSAGETTKTISVNVGSTIVGKANKRFAVNLNSPHNALFADGKALATILDTN